MFLNQIVPKWIDGTHNDEIFIGFIENDIFSSREHKKYAAQHKVNFQLKAINIFGLTFVLKSVVALGKPYENYMTERFAFRYSIQTQLFNLCLITPSMCRFTITTNKKGLKNA